MRIITFAKRCFKEIVRDPLSFIFSLILPLFLLFIFQQFKIPNEVYKLNNFTPGIILFSFAFVTLFVATLVAKDRETSLLIRLGVSPMHPHEYIIGYMLAVMPMVIIQNILFFTLAIILGLTFSMEVIWTILVSLVISLLFIFLGILIGSITKVKSASGVSSVIVQVVCFTSGMYFSTDLVSNTFAKICSLLPFGRALNIIRNVLNMEVLNILDILVVLVYTVVVLVISIIVFKKKMISDNK